MKNLRAEAHGTCRRYVMDDLRAEAHGTGERDSVPRHLCRRCVMKNLRAEAHGTGREILYHDIYVVGV